MSASDSPPDPAEAGQPAKSQNVAFVAGLDHLRGFAAILVVIHHAYWTALGKFQPPMMNWAAWPEASSPLSAPFIEAHVAVGVFFVVSGFIFTLAAFQRRLRYGSYMRNRALRVLPVYFAVLFFGLALYPQRFELAKVLMTATIFSDFPLQGINLHPVSTAFWTVAVEVQFYLIFPFLIAIYGRAGARPLWMLLGLMLAFRTIGFLLGISSVPASPAASIRELNYWHLVPGHLDQFLIGMLGARFYMRWREDPRAAAFGAPNALGRLVAALMRRPALAASLGAVAFFGYVFLLNRLGGYPDDRAWKILQPTLEALACFALVLGWLVLAPRLPRLLDRIFTFVGDISFPMYIAHFVLVGLIVGDPIAPHAFPGLGIDFSTWWPEINGHQNALATTFLLVLPATFVLAYLLHAGVEAPFMRLRRRYVSPSESA